MQLFIPWKLSPNWNLDSFSILVLAWNMLPFDNKHTTYQPTCKAIFTWQQFSRCPFIYLSLFVKIYKLHLGWKDTNVWNVQPNNVFFVVLTNIAMLTLLTKTSWKIKRLNAFLLDGCLELKACFSIICWAPTFVKREWSYMYWNLMDQPSFLPLQ